VFYLLLHPHLSSCYNYYNHLKRFLQNSLIYFFYNKYLSKLNPPFVEVFYIELSFFQNFQFQLQLNIFEYERLLVKIIIHTHYLLHLFLLYLFLGNNFLYFVAYYNEVPTLYLVCLFPYQMHL